MMPQRSVTGIHPGVLRNAPFELQFIQVGLGRGQVIPGKEKSEYKGTELKNKTKQNKNA